jgi:molybdopterin molybdotransferase
LSALLSVAEARQRLVAAFSPLETESVHLAKSAGRVLAAELVSSLDLPLFANSSMDGFAVCAADVAPANPQYPVTLRVVADVPAGQVSPTGIGAGEAVRIMTGAPLPAGADAVVPVEDTDHYQDARQPGVDAPGLVRIRRSVQAGDYVRPQGQDVRSGEVIMDRGVRLRPQDVGFLAMLGVAQVPVFRRPRVALISTGDELLPVEVPLQPGKIHDSNAYTLAALVEREGGEPVNLGITSDREQAVRASLDQAVSIGADLILSSAGVSVGAFDFVRTVVEQQGRLQFWRVNMRPGKPLAFGSYQDVPFIGLPGNPVSAFIGFEVFVRPALLKMAGLPDQKRPAHSVYLLDAIESDGRESYLRAVVKAQGDRLLAKLTGHQGSGNLRSLVQANALLIVPSGVKSLPAGTRVNAWLLGELEENRFGEQ